MDFIEGLARSRIAFGMQYCCNQSVGMSIADSYSKVEQNAAQGLLPNQGLQMWEVVQNIDILSNCRVLAFKNQVKPWGRGEMTWRFILDSSDWWSYSELGEKCNQGILIARGSRVPVFYLYDLYSVASVCDLNDPQCTGPSFWTCHAHGCSQDSTSPVAFASYEVSFDLPLPEISPCERLTIYNHFTAVSDFSCPRTWLPAPGKTASRKVCASSVDLGEASWRFSSKVPSSGGHPPQHPSKTFRNFLHCYTIQNIQSQIKMLRWYVHMIPKVRITYI